MIDRLRRLLRQQTPPATPPVRYLPLLEIPEPAPAPAPKRDTEPRPLESYELAGERCPQWDCGLPAASGTFRRRDLGPHQLIYCRTYRCPAGHGWSFETDGG